MKTTQPIVNFNSGEISPLLIGRVDLRQYNSACRRMRNFIPAPQGPARRRSGTRFVAETKNSAARSWLREFIFSDNQAYVLEFGNLYIRFFANHGVVGAPFEVVTPYTTANLVADDGTFALKMTQIGDVIYITHPLVPIQKLTRTGAATFVLSVFAFDDGPFEDINPANPITVYTNGVSGGIQITASAAAFQPNALIPQLLVDSLILIEPKIVDGIKLWEPNKGILLNDERRSDGKIYKAIGGIPACTIVNVDIATERITSDIPHGLALWDPWVSPGGGGGLPAPLAVATTYYVQSVPSPNELTLALVQGGPAINLTTAPVGATFTGKGTTGTVRPTHANSYLQFPYASRFDGNNGVQWEFQNPGYGIARILNVVSSTVVDAGVLLRIPSSAVGAGNATQRWALDPFNDAPSLSQYPDNVYLFRERLIFTRNRELWSSQSADYPSFAERDIHGLITAETAMVLDTTGDRVDPIKWMAESNEALLIGTAGDEHALIAPVDSEPFGPANAAIRRQSAYGSRGVRPLTIGESVLFVQKAGRKIRDMRMAESVNVKWVANDLNILAEHVTESGIVDMTYQQEPDSIIWAVMNDGRLAGFTYNPEQEIRGWHQHRIGGYSNIAQTEFAVVESVVSIPSPDQTHDEVWMIVRRYINGVVRRYVEYMEKQRSVNDDPEDSFFVDSGLSLNNTVNADLTPGVGATVKGTAGVTFTASLPVFVVGDIGKFIHYRFRTVNVKGEVEWTTAVAEITGFTNNNVVTGTIRRPWPSVTPAGAVAASGVVAVTHTTGFTYDRVPTFTFVGGGGAGAVAEVHMQAMAWAFAVGGAGYLAGEILTLAGGVFTRPVLLRVLFAGAALEYDIIDHGDYTVLPGASINVGGLNMTGPIAVTGGSGAGATVYIGWGVGDGTRVSNPGAGYTSNPAINVGAGGVPNVATAAAFIAGSLGAPASGVAAMMPANTWRKTVTLITGLNHLEGQVVSVCADGSQQADKVVVGGNIVLDSPASKVHVGLSCPAVLMPIPLHVNDGTGSSIGKTKRAAKVSILFVETVGCKYGRDEDTQQDTVVARSPTDPMDVAPPVFSGIKTVSWPDGHSDELLLTIKQDTPLPCTIAAIVPHVDVSTTAPTKS